ncbi:hypothetical protein ASD78_17710 [Lysobacter sp. Root667]|uniref:YidB family protein n=1 Tax=Lysobacter sp. Root667 TaxID=1736581 RepID=UPI0006F3EDE4|nr:YidB family protein [Lysobacter sp. Root667]KRA70675.1 hypothetical protein ASD78_17710 [Lysobacter sp. Root667]
MFEHLLDQVASRHGLNPDQAQRLLAAWKDRIFDPARGGPSGFVQAFRAQGLEDLAASWIAPGPNRPLTADQLERVFGESEIAALARILDLPAAAVASASAAILPEAVDSLGEDDRWHGGHDLGREGEWPDPQEPGSGFESSWPGAFAAGSPVTGSAATSSDEPVEPAPIGLHPVRDTGPSPFAASDAPLYRAEDDPLPRPRHRHRHSYWRRLWPWLLLFALLAAIALLLRG